VEDIVPILPLGAVYQTYAISSWPEFTSLARTEEFLHKSSSVAT